MKKYDTIADIEIDIAKDQSSLQTLREFKVSRDVMPAASANALTSLICMWFMTSAGSSSASSVAA
jgi:hypothetical protein